MRLRPRINAKKALVFVIVAACVVVLDYYFVYNKPGSAFVAGPPKASLPQQTGNLSMKEAFDALKARRDRDALALAEAALISEPSNLDAMCVKAEVLRRMRRYNEAEVILTQVLNKDPGRCSAIISSAYIRYKYAEFDKALELLKAVVEGGACDKENLALAYATMGAVNSKQVGNTLLLGKLYHVKAMKEYFAKAKDLAPELAETRVGLGSFYMFAPFFLGGNLEKAIVELEYAVKLAPDFATANARLAQAYKKKKDTAKYQFYLLRAKSLDPENEVVKEIE